MTWGVGVLGTESRAESIDGTEGHGAEFAFELSGDSEAGGLAEEVVTVVDFAVRAFLQVVEVFRGDLEHLTGAFAVAGSDEGRVEIEEAVLVEVVVHGHGHVVADAEDRAESIGAQTQMGVLAHVFEGLAFLLHGEVAAALTEHLDGCSLDFSGLACALAFDEDAFNAQAGTGGDEFEHVGIKLLHIGHHLHVLDGGAIVECDEVDTLTAAARTHPSLHAHSGAKVGAAQKVVDFCSFHILVVCLFIVICHGGFAVGAYHSAAKLRFSPYLCNI